METLVIFDIDNTLVYSDGRDSRTFAEAFCYLYGGELPSINWHEYPHVTDFTIINEIFKLRYGRPATDQEHDELTKEYALRAVIKRQENPDLYYVVPHAKETVRNLQNEGYTVGIASGGLRLIQEIKLHHLGFSPIPQYAAYADNKPTREDIINDLFRQTGGKQFEKIVYIGDALWDVVTTRNMQIPFIGVRRRGDLETLTAEGAQHVITDFSDYELFKKYLKEAVPPTEMDSMVKALEKEEDND